MLLALVAGLAQTPSPTAQVSGRVVEQGSGAPLAGARVILARRLPGPPTMPLSGPAPAIATTDADGRFAFTDVAPGPYVTTADRAGFAADTTGQPPASFDLAAGVSKDDIVVTLQRGGAIAGRVVDATGEPIPGLRVVPFRPSPAPPGGTTSAQPPRMLPTSGGSQTNDIGEFRIASLPPGEYYVQAALTPLGPVASGGPTSGAHVMVPTYFPSVIDGDGAQRVAVQAGQTTGDIVIHMQSTPAFGISGVVTDEAGQPVVNALVQVMTRPSPATLVRAPQARTDSRGAFTVTGVANGTYTLIAVPPRVTQAGPSTGTFVGSVTNTGAGFVSSETRNGITTQFTESDGTKITMTVNGSDVGGVQLSVHRIQ
ncbi:MAG: carboxypeptidase-like regulatory domain-containing protein [Vicinamibacterales bacterium]